MIIDPAEHDRRTLNGLVNGLVYPRPIAWTSTVAADGTRNLAPFSFFNAFSFHPHPTLGIGPGARHGIDKDTLANVRAAGEFVVNLVSAELAETANHCSAELPVDEWDPRVSRACRARSSRRSASRARRHPSSVACSRSSTWAIRGCPRTRW
jgi:flavin reductase (DIM6/NTAB) family NADH-FMN oxidoreductase RutF